MSEPSAEKLSAAFNVVAQAIVTLCAGKYKLADVSLEFTFEDFELDSLDAIEMVMEIEEIADVEFDEELEGQFNKKMSVQAAVVLLAAHPDFNP